MSIFSPVQNWQAAREAMVLLFRHRELAWEMTKREMTEKHAGQALGGLWAIGHPVAIMGVFIFIFAVVFKGKIETAGLSLPLDFTAYILTGLIPWLVFQEALVKGTTAVSGNAQIVKQVVFPIELLPVRVVIAALISQTIFIVLLAIYVLFRVGTLHATFAFVPVLMCLQALAMSGICFLFSAVGCYFRDLKEVVTVFGLVNVYLMPVVYLPEWVPQTIRPFLHLNPFSYMIWCYQDAIFFGRFEHTLAWVLFPLLSVACFVLGCRAFRELKIYLGDVL